MRLYESNASPLPTFPREKTTSDDVAEHGRVSLNRSLVESPERPLRRVRIDSSSSAVLRVSLSQSRWLSETSSLVSVNLIVTWAEVLKVADAFSVGLEGIDFDSVLHLCQRLSPSQLEVFFTFITEISG